MSQHASGADVRAGLDHPIIDADGHWIEYTPVFAEQVRKAAGAKAEAGFRASQKRLPELLSLSIEERKRRGLAQDGYWARSSTNTVDRATSMLPRMLYDRLDEFGIDFGIVYPTAGLGIVRIADDETRRATCRGYNIVAAEYFAKLSDRLTPVAAIPAHTPEEAIAELEFAVKQLGAKVCMLASGIPRPLPAAAGADAELARFAVRFDQLGLDSDYDYDPVWETCRALGVAPTFHTGGRGFALRASPSNYTFNHIGHFAEAGQAVAKALFLGGVTRRYPELNFAFLEGGAGWGCQLFADLTEHWERRSKAGIAYNDPMKLDRALLKRFIERYGYAEIAAEVARRDGWPNLAEDLLTGGDTVLDDFALCGLSRKEDWVALFARPFYFGCEADDRMSTAAFGKANPFGARINAMFSTDNGHFDVQDMRKPAVEAWELVQEGLLTRDDFRDFVFANAVRLWGTQNPRFFEGTRVAGAAVAVLSAAPARAAAE
jgi:predicted TIM-barrel fold metal-dependent hydrolase